MSVNVADGRRHRGSGLPKYYAIKAMAEALAYRSNSDVWQLGSPPCVSADPARPPWKSVCGRNASGICARAWADHAVGIVRIP